MEFSKIIDKNNFEVLRINEYKENLKKQFSEEGFCDLNKEIDLNDPNSILEFGKDSCLNIVRISGEILNYLRVIKENNKDNLLNKIDRIIDSFDIKDFEEEKQGIIKRFFKKDSSIDKVTKKYLTLGADIESFYRELKTEEQIINEGNKKLQFMLFNNIKACEDLERHTVYLEKIKEEFLLKNQNTIEGKKDLNNIEFILEMIENRIEDFKTSEIILIESIIIIKEIENSNKKLLEKINSSLVVTLPIFKEYLTRIMILKREELKIKSINIIKKDREKISNNKNLLDEEKKQNIKKILNKITLGVYETKESYKVNKKIAEDSEIRLKSKIK